MFTLKVTLQINYYDEHLDLLCSADSLSTIQFISSPDRSIYPLNLSYMMKGQSKNNCNFIKKLFYSLFSN